MCRKTDSLNNQGHADSLNTQRHVDSLNNQRHVESLNNQRPSESLNNQRQSMERRPIVIRLKAPDVVPTTVCVTVFTRSFCVHKQLPWF